MTRATVSAVAVCLLGCAITGCEGASDLEPGGDAAAMASTEEVDAGAAAEMPPVLPSFDSIYDSVFATCTGCHGEWLSTGTVLELLTPDGAYANLVGAAVNPDGQCADQGLLVAPGDCEGSVLIQKLRGYDPAATVCGAAMPQLPPALPSATIDTICQWIDAGAQR